MIPAYENENSDTSQLKYNKCPFVDNSEWHEHFSWATTFICRKNKRTYS